MWICVDSLRREVERCLTVNGLKKIQRFKSAPCKMLLINDLIQTTDDYPMTPMNVQTKSGKIKERKSLDIGVRYQFRSGGGVCCLMRSLARILSPALARIFLQEPTNQVILPKYYLHFCPKMAIWKILRGGGGSAAPSPTPSPRTPMSVENTCI